MAHVREFLTRKYPEITLPEIVVEQPPKIELGEFALPVALKLARGLRKAPLKIAQEIVAEMPLPEGFASFEVAGAGYINARLDRSAAAAVVAAEGDGNAATDAAPAAGAGDAVPMADAGATKKRPV